MDFASRIALAVAMAAWSAACGESSSASRPDAALDSFDRSALLGHLAQQILLPAQIQVAATAAQLPSAIAPYCDALAQPQSGPVIADALAAARGAFSQAIDAWEMADAMLVGPAAMDHRALRDRIYGWPLLSTCGLDRDTASSFAEPASYDPATRLVNTRSLAAVEYLLYSAQTAHTCPTTPTGWDALGGNLALARCRHALAIANDVSVHAAALATAWRGDGGNYAAQLALAGRTGSAIASAQDAVNLISDAMFYADSVVKDMKLGEAAGIAVNACGAVDAPCEREVELRYADRSSAAIRINLRALRQLFTGTAPTGDGPAFDDFLTALGHADVADRMRGKLDAAIAAADALPDSFLAALAQHYDQVVATYRAIDAFTDDLKSQFLTLLALEIPDDVATDND
jgi:predicted lipoprotein